MALRAYFFGDSQRDYSAPMYTDGRWARMRKLDIWVAPSKMQVVNVASISDNDTFLSRICTSDESSPMHV
eukprot:scaffold65312_cov33-Tisochrysis_lutea.AAC.7